MIIRSVNKNPERRDLKNGNETVLQVEQKKVIIRLPFDSFPV